MVLINNQWEIVECVEDVQRIIRENFSEDLARKLGSLNNNYESMYKNLQEDYEILKDEYHDLLDDYEDLESEIESLKKS